MCILQNESLKELCMYCGVVNLRIIIYCVLQYVCLTSVQRRRKKITNSTFSIHILQNNIIINSTGSTQYVKNYQDDSYVHSSIASVFAMEE